MRDISTIDKVIIHHSISLRDLELEKSLSSFERTHSARFNNPGGYKWTENIQYHYVISGNGDWKKVRPLKSVAHHASNRQANKTSIGICLTGNFDIEEPSNEQYQTLSDIITELETWLWLLELHTHSEYSNKTCPWINFDIAKIETANKTEEEKREQLDIMEVLNSAVRKQAELCKDYVSWGETIELLEDVQVSTHLCNQYIRSKGY